MKFPSPNQVIFHFQKALGSNYSLCTVNYLQIFIWIAGPRKAEPFWPRLTLNKPQILVWFHLDTWSLVPSLVLHGSSLWS